MIISAKYTNVNGSIVDLNDDDIPFNRFTTEVDVRMTEREKSQQHGIYPSNTYLGKRLFHCEGDLFAATSYEYMQRRLALVGAFLPRPHFGFKHSGVLDILWDGIPEHLTSDCTIDGWPELPLEGGNAARSSFLVNLKSFDPRMYGALNTVNIDYNASENLGGLTFNFTFPFNFASGAAGINDVTIINAGNIETYPVVDFIGPCVDPQLILTRSDGTTHYFKLLGVSLGPGETATADFLRRTVTRSDGANLYNYAIDSDWWAIESPPITNVVRFAIASGAAPAKAVLKWRNAYMI